MALDLDLLNSPIIRVEPEMPPLPQPRWRAPGPLTPAERVMVRAYLRRGGDVSSEIPGALRQARWALAGAAQACGVEPIDLWHVVMHRAAPVRDLLYRELRDA